MRDALGPGTVLGYCTNVHAGATLGQTLANLETHAARAHHERATEKLHRRPVDLAEAEAIQEVHDNRHRHPRKTPEEKGIEEVQCFTLFLFYYHFQLHRSLNKK